MSSEEGIFDAYIDREWEKQQAVKNLDFTQSLNIAVVGGVSVGKSSLLNAFLRRGRRNVVAEVGAEAGVTKDLKIISVGDRVRVVDTPGLGDVDVQRSQATRDFIQHIDVGILVVVDAVTDNTKKEYEFLKQKAKSTFVVLNKWDLHDRTKRSSKENLLRQWCTTLGVDRVYPTCANGYDSEDSDDAPLDIRGVDELRRDVEAFLAGKGKDLLLARVMGDKRSYAIGIIATALMAVAGEAFIPGSAVYITVTQALAITSLYYLYTGRVLTKAQALAAIPLFLAQAAGFNLFLVVKSVLPPTGILDLAAAAVAVTVTLAMLVAVAGAFAEGHEIHERDLLRARFGRVRERAEQEIRASSLTDWKSLEFWKRLLERLMYNS